MENNRVMVFIGSFLFGMSVVLIILAMFFVKQIDTSIPKNSRDYLEVILGWVGATIIGGGIALKHYMDVSGGGGFSSYGGGNDDAGDSAVAFVTGLSLALYALLATWLWIIGVPNSVFALCLLSSACSFLGLIIVSYFSGQEG